MDFFPQNIVNYNSSKKKSHFDKILSKNDTDTKLWEVTIKVVFTCFLISFSIVYLLNACQ